MILSNCIVTLICVNSSLHYAILSSTQTMPCFLSFPFALFVYSTHDVIRGYHILLVQAE